MKRILALLLAGALCLPLLACNKDDDKPDNTELPTVEVTQPVTDPSDSSNKPEDTSVEPEDTSVEPEGTSVEPEDTSVEPEDTSVEPEDTSVEPEDTSVEPEDTSIAEPATDLVVDVAGHALAQDFSAAGYTANVIKFTTFGKAANLGTLDLSKYEKVIITYGSDQGAMLGDLGAKVYLTSTGAIADAKNNPIDYTELASATLSNPEGNWASGSRTVEISLANVNYNGTVYLTYDVANHQGIAVSAITFAAPGDENNTTVPEDTTSEDPSVEATDPVYSVPLTDLYNHGQQSTTNITLAQHCTSAWGSNNGYVTLTANGKDPYVTAIPIGTSTTVTNRLYLLYRTKHKATAEIYIGSGNGWSGQGDCVVSSEYTADGKWHLLAINLNGATALLNKQATYMRFDFFAGSNKAPYSGQTLDVKMLAFFNSDAEAKAYAAAKYGTDYSGTYTPPVVEPSTPNAEITMPGNLTLPFKPSQPIKMNKDWKAIWLSQFDMSDIYRKNGGQRPEAEFRSLVNRMLNNVVCDGYNTVVVQVRPNADSMYPSEYYPASKYVVGSYGRDFSYDPFAIVVEIAHQKGLDVHAWINPMRGMSDAEMQSISTKYAMKRWYNDPSKNGKYVVKVNGLWYLNPAYEEVRALIVNGAVEIVKKYDVQGVHMDDYFYPVAPSQTSFDSAAYNAYCAENGSISVADFRRANLNKLVSALYGYIKKADSNAIFGVSPAGNLDKVQNTHCADVYRWCSTPGYIDYIMPQVYWGFEHKSHAFDKICNVWQDIIKTDYVKLIIGVTFGKAASGVDDGAGDGKFEWTNHKDVLARSVNYSTTLSKCVGITVFSYNYIYDPVSGAWKSETSAEHTNFNNALKSANYNASSK